LDEGSTNARGISTGNVSGMGIIIGEDIKTGDISINVVYETIKNFGLNLLPSTYFKDNQKTDENFAKWKKGFPLRLPSIMKGLEFRRENLLKDIKSKLESNKNNHCILILGKPGSSKSTILMELICDYFKMGYQILYNWENNNKIANTSDAAEFIGKLLNNDNKILIAVDNVHTENAVGIFPIIVALSSHNKRENLAFILTARTPDYERFLDEKVSRLSPDIRISIQEIDDKSFRYPLPSFTEPEIAEFIKYYFNEIDVKEYIREARSKLFLQADDDYKGVASSLYKETHGDLIRIRFLVFGKGLALDARLSYDDYLQDNAKKLLITLVCSLSDLANYVVTKEVFEYIQLSDYAIDLNEESILDFSDGTYRTKHPSWDLELLSYMFNVKNKTVLRHREQILRYAVNLLFEIKDPNLTKSIISAAYDSTKLLTEDGGRLPIEIIEHTIEVPKNLDDMSKYKIYTVFHRVGLLRFEDVREVSRYFS
jgi:hypothetical protein